jgi:hypothetical protein
MDRMKFTEFAAKFCAVQEPSPAGLRGILAVQRARYFPDGWMLLECHMMDSSRLGELTILPYGPSNTYKEIPSYPISPRGLASDMSVVVAYMPVEDLPLE